MTFNFYQLTQQEKWQLHTNNHVLLSDYNFKRKYIDFYCHLIRSLDIKVIKRWAFTLGVWLNALCFQQYLHIKWEFFLRCLWNSLSLDVAVEKAYSSIKKTRTFCWRISASHSVSNIAQNLGKIYHPTLREYSVLAGLTPALSFARYTIPANFIRDGRNVPGENPLKATNLIWRTTTLHRFTFLAASPLEFLPFDSLCQPASLMKISLNTFGLGQSKTS